MEEQQTHVVLWKKGEDGSIEILAQAPIRRLDDPYWPNPFFLSVGERMSPENAAAYAQEVAESMGDVGRYEDQIKVRVPAKALLDKGLWLAACDELGINEWAINEGRMDSSEELVLTQRQAKKIGLL